MASNTSATMTNKTAIITGGSRGLGRFNCTETEKKSMNDAITSFILAVPQADLEDLNRRIDQTRWPDAKTVDDWTQGAPLAKVKALVDHWCHRYDGADPRGCHSQTIGGKP